MQNTLQSCRLWWEVKWKSFSCVWLFATPWTIYSPWNSSGHNSGVGSLSLLQGIFPTQGSNPGLPHWRRILYQLSHKGSPRILEWIASPFSSGSFQPRNWTGVSCIVGRFFTNWAIKEALRMRSWGVYSSTPCHWLMTACGEGTHRNFCPVHPPGLHTVQASFLRPEKSPGAELQL